MKLNSEPVTVMRTSFITPQPRVPARRLTRTTSANSSSATGANTARVFRAALFALLFLLGIFTPSLTRAGSGRINPGDHTLDITVNLRFAPSPEHITDMHNRLIGASQLLWDATDGQLRLGRVTLKSSPAANAEADVWSYLEYGGTQSAVSGLGKDGFHVDYYFLPGDTAGRMLAHELGHLALGLWDEYEDPNRCIGFCVEEDSTIPGLMTCLMQQGGDWSELCTRDTHDPRRGDRKSCSELGISPPCDDPGRCLFVEAASGKVEASQQQINNGRSCWEQLELNFPFMRAPVGSPADAPPPGFNPPEFDDQCFVADTVMLVLDHSFSMSFNTTRDDGPVCPATGDPVPDCTGPRIEFVKAAARAWLELARDSGVRAGLTVFNDTPDYRLTFRPVNAHEIYDAAGFRSKIDEITPSGSTAIGNALQRSIEAFDDDSLAGNKAVLLITDGVNTSGPNPRTKLADLQRRNIRLFTVSTGTASDDGTLRSLSGFTRGIPTDAHSATTLVNFFAQQWASYRNLSTIEPLKHYLTDSKQTNSVFRVEENTPNLTLVFAGDLNDMSVFGVRALLTGPAGAGPSSFDTEHAAPGMTVFRDGYFMIVKLQNLNPGEWSLRIMEAPGTASGQTGNLTILSDHPEMHLFASLDRYVVEDASVPVELNVVPIYHAPLHNLESVTATVKRPDGSLVPLAIQPDRRHGEAFYSARVTDMPFAGNYEVRVSVRTGPRTFHDPGEPIFHTGPAPIVPVPRLERQAVRHFFVPHEIATNDPDHAMPLNLEGGTASVKGSIHPHGDVDYYRIPAGAGTKIWINVDTGGAQNPGATSRDSVVTLLDAATLTPVEEDENDGSGNGADGTLESGDASVIAGHTITADGDYLIAVRARSPYDVIDPYVLTVVTTDSAPHPESEPNNTVSSPNPITPPIGRRTGALATPGDVDYYSINVAAEQVLTIMADGDPERDGTGTDLVVDLIAPNPILAITTLFSADSSMNGSASDPAGEGFRYAVGTNAGTYLIRVAHRSAKGTGTYDLMVSAQSPGLLEFSAPRFSVFEDGRLATIPVRRLGGSAGTVTVRFAAFNESAMAPSDYLSTGGTLTFNGGETEKNIALPIISDGIPEPDETVGLILYEPSDGAALGSVRQATLTIVDQHPELSAPRVLVPTGSVWRYLNSGTDPGTAWRGANFDDILWLVGNAELGYGDGGEATLLQGGHVTDYFRRSFFVTNATDFGAAEIRLRRDDGAIVYLNGVEVFRSNMPTGMIHNATLASSPVSGADESTFFTSAFSPSLLRTGENILAVEVHQNSTNSSDLSFDLELKATPQPEPPIVGVRLANSGIVIDWPASASNFTLEQVDGLGNGFSWYSVQANPALNNGRFEVFVPATAPQRFFRLRWVQP